MTGPDRPHEPWTDDAPSAGRPAESPTDDSDVTQAVRVDDIGPAETPTPAPSRSSESSDQFESSARSAPQDSGPAANSWSPGSRSAQPDPEATAVHSTSDFGGPPTMPPPPYGSYSSAPDQELDPPRAYETPGYAPPSGPSPTTAYGPPPYGAPASGNLSTTYSYQDQPTAYGAPPMEPRPARERIVLPKAPSRIGQNLLAGLVGLVLSVGGIALLAIVIPEAIRPSSGVMAKILYILAVVIVMLPTLLIMWGPLAALVPGVLFTATSIWLLVVDQGADQLRNGLGGRLFAEQLIVFFKTLPGLAAGLGLLFAGIAAIVIRRYTRRTVQDAFDADHASAEMRPMLHRDQYT